MPKLGNAVPKYRRHKASGQAMVTLVGRDFYLGPYGTKVSHDEYDRLIAEWLANDRRLPQEVDPATTVEELLAAFWLYAQGYYVGTDGKPKTEIVSYRLAMKPLRQMYGDTYTDDFGPLKIKAIRELFISKGHARKSINQQIGRIKRIFKWGVENELVAPGVFQGLQAVSGLKKGRSEARETPPVKPVSEVLVEAVKPYVSKQVWAMIQLQLLTGMRSGEVTIMRMSDISKKGKVWEYRPETHKMAYRDKERVISLGPKAQGIINTFQDRDPMSYLFSPQEAMNDRNAKRRDERKTPMTPSQAKRRAKKNPEKSPGEKYDTQSYGRAIKSAIKKAKCDHWTPHQLRHTAATRIREKYGLEAAQVTLGHSRADVTQIYAEANVSKAAAVMAEIG